MGSEMCIRDRLESEEVVQNHASEQVVQCHALSEDSSLELGNVSGFSHIGHGVRANSFGGRGRCVKHEPQFCSGDCADDFVCRRHFSVFHKEVLPSRSPSLGHPIVMPLREAAKNVRLRDACLRTSEFDGEMNTSLGQVMSDGSSSRFLTARPVGECLT